jgi:DNA-binding transcriptional regulator GbsR (MarR family)
MHTLGAPQKPAAPLPPELRQLEQVVGRFIEHWGFKKIHGRIWVHLYTSKQPLESLELVKRLGVSKGLISIALRDLLDYRVVAVDHTGRHGTTYYSANPNLMEVIGQVLRSRESVMLGTAKHASESLGRLKPSELESVGIDLDRVRSIEAMTVSAQGVLQVFLMQDGTPAGGGIFSPLLTGA